MGNQVVSKFKDYQNVFMFLTAINCFNLYMLNKEIIKSTNPYSLLVADTFFKKEFKKSNNNNLKDKYAITYPSIGKIHQNTDSTIILSFPVILITNDYFDNFQNDTLECLEKLKSKNHYSNFAVKYEVFKHNLFLANLKIKKFLGLKLNPKHEDNAKRDFIKISNLFCEFLIYENELLKYYINKMQVIQSINNPSLFKFIDNLNLNLQDSDVSKINQKKLNKLELIGFNPFLIPSISHGKYNHTLYFNYRDSINDSNLEENKNKIVDNFCILKTMALITKDSFLSKLDNYFNPNFNTYLPNTKKQNFSDSISEIAHPFKLFNKDEIDKYRKKTTSFLSLFYLEYNLVRILPLYKTYYKGQIYSEQITKNKENEFSLFNPFKQLFNKVKNDWIYVYNSFQIYQMNSVYYPINNKYIKSNKNISYMRKDSTDENKLSDDFIYSSISETNQENIQEIANYYLNNNETNSYMSNLYKIKEENIAKLSSKVKTELPAKPINLYILKDKKLFYEKTTLVLMAIMIGLLGRKLLAIKFVNSSKMIEKEFINIIQSKCNLPSNIVFSHFKSKKYNYLNQNYQVEMILTNENSTYKVNYNFYKYDNKYHIDILKINEKNKRL